MARHPPSCVPQTSGIAVDFPKTRDLPGKGHWQPTGSSYWLTGPAALGTLCGLGDRLPGDRFVPDASQLGRGWDASGDPGTLAKSTPTWQSPWRGVTEAAPGKRPRTVMRRFESPVDPPHSVAKRSLAHDDRLRGRRSRSEAVGTPFRAFSVSLSG